MIQKSLYFSLYNSNNIELMKSIIIKWSNSNIRNRKDKSLACFIIKQLIERKSNPYQNDFFMNCYLDYINILKTKQ